MTIANEIQKKVHELPPLSKSASRLMDLLDNEIFTQNEIARIVETDSKLTANVLQVVNSPVYGLDRKITSIPEAVDHLGERMILSIAYESCTDDIYKKSLCGYECYADELWAHSLKTAIASRWISFFAVDVLDADICYTAGLLHDVGKSVISDYLAESDVRFDEISTEMGLNYLEIEMEVTGTNHCETGVEISKKWDLPSRLTQAIGHHHHPKNSSTEHLALVYAVHLGDMIAMMMGHGTGLDSMQYTIDKDYSNHIDITEEDLENLKSKIEMEFKKTVESLMNSHK